LGTDCRSIRYYKQHHDSDVDREGSLLDETDKETEAALVARARAGDVAAYEELVRRYQQVAFRVAYVIAGSAQEAEDAAQEGFLRAYRALSQLRADAPLRPWLLTIIANAARTRRANVARHPTLSLSVAADRASNEPDSSPEWAAVMAEQRRELLAAIQALRPDDREMIACRYLLDLSEAETAGVLGCPRGTVKSRLSRALQRLRQQLVTDSGATERGRDADG
jgi:RNA polymerase sigma-70 factor (ECF subfamily)